ncbi:PAPS reductase-like domain protein [Gordonia phage Morgana]|uniref:PAPS reductase-like domain protein n=1 Tax=Gordonia phage Morgana TaxID=3137292 RepID=A0AAX4RD72_9CAUD
MISDQERIDKFRGVPSSTMIFDQLAESGETVILNFSRGKDSIAVWIELEKRGIPLIAIHKSPVPGLKFIEDDLKRYEDYFGHEIIDLPSDGFLRRLANKVWQTPERCAIIEAAQLPELTREEWDRLMRLKYATEDTWILDGVRATDSATRRMAMQQYGPIKERAKRMSPIWDWGIGDVRDAIAKRGITLGIEYEWFGRSIDGIGYTYADKLRQHVPDDYERVRFWFPMIDLDQLRFTEGGAEL